MKNCSMHTDECHCLSWKPIIAGALVIIGLTFLLNLFSVAIGLSAFTTSSDGVQKVVLSGLFATAVGIIASMFGSGWITGYLSQRHCSKRHLGALYGFLTWCLALILAVFLASHLEDYVSFYANFISGTPQAHAVVTTAGDTVKMKSDSLVVSTYIIFALFFLSAFATSLGGHCGASYVCKNTSN